MKRIISDSLLMSNAIRYLLFLIIAPIVALAPVQAADQADSLLRLCKQTVATQPETVKTFANQLLAAGEQENNLLLIGQSHYFLGAACRYTGEFPAALAHLQKSLAALKNYPSDQCLTLKETGVVHYLLGESEKAMTFYTQALEIAMAKQLTPEIIAINNNIGNLFDQQRHYDKAIAHYQEGLELNPEPVVKAILLGNIAKAQAGKGKLDEALKLYQESAAICRKQRDNAGLIAALNGIASIYWRQERDQDVLEVSETLLQLQTATSQTTDRIETYNRMGLAYLNLGQPRQAIHYFNQALALSQRSHYARTHYIYANLAFAYENAGDYKQAYQHFQKHKHLQDSLQTLEKDKQLEELLTKYEANKKSQQIQLLEQQKKLQQLVLHKQQAEISRQTWLRNAIILAALLLLVPALVFLFFYRQKMRSNLILAAQAEELNRQHSLELIRQQEIKSITDNMEGREKERKRIARELHDGVAGSLAGIKLHLIRIADEHAQQTTLEKVIRNVDAVYREVRTISHNLNPPEITHTAFIDLLREQLRQFAQNSQIELEFICHPEPQLNQLPDTLKIEIYRILQELMTNIGKHAEATSVEVQFTQTEEAINLMVEDQGKGFDTAHTTYGLGMSNIQTRVSQLSGTLHLESVKGRGTIVSIDFPLPEMLLESRVF